MQQRPLQRLSGALVSAIAFALLVGACAANGAPGSSKLPGPARTKAATPAPARTPTPTSTPTTAAVLKQARLLSSQYDYDKALAALTGDGSAEALAEAEKINAVKASLVKWPDNVQVSHIFYHSLVIDPNRAFGPSQPQRKGYLDYMVTADEFRKQLTDLHQRGYVLILPRKLMVKEGAEMVQVPLMLPPGKKPLILSIDDVSYYEYMNDAGFASKLILGANGKVTNIYFDASGKEHKGAYDVSTIVDEFVEKNPDFSYRGDKGIFALTGYNGVFGYRTSEWKYGKNDKTTSEQEEAKKIAAALKKTGWEFASHSWGHISLTKASVGEISQDSDRWDAEVRPLLGDVDQYILAFGADISDMTPYSFNNPKYVELNQKRHFNYIFPIDASVEHWGQVSAGSWRNARINVDGISMNRALANPRDILNNFFDVKAASDPARTAAG